ncbi:hypothetical protein TNCV_2739531 [Trichonephila clavipes]|nr:hypothetical protein TNCV_2739531 [Trichonephila clavipes]
MCGVHDLSRAAQRAYRGRNSFESIQMVSKVFMSGARRNSMTALRLGPLRKFRISFHHVENAVVERGTGFH